MKDKDPTTSGTLSLPEKFDDYEYEVEAKGWFGDTTLAHEGKSYRLNFYSPTRLRQEIESDLQRGSVFFFEPNLVVIPSVTRRNMEKAASELMQSGNASSLVAE